MDKHTHRSKKKLIHLLITISFSILVMGWLIVTVSNYNMSYTSDIATILNQGLITVQTDAMNGNSSDSFSSNDLVIVEMLENDAYLNLSVGNVITFYSDESNELLTQRIVGVYQDQDVYYFETKEDMNYSSSEIILASEVIAVYKDKIVGFGNSFNYLQTPKGFTIFVMLPVFTILIYEILILARNLIQYKKIRFENSFDRRYKEALRNLEEETLKIRQQVMANWIIK
ncbi:MAG: hypothetical protein CVV58_04495 [Tenericutes bacterium HGW-Tenericutes-3]|nr:MAG: hypothetical protein CVV58_04495 [Tenericutes bacterium HGW-Tenericutes-3]